MKRTIILVLLTITFLKIALPQDDYDKNINLSAGTGYMFSCHRQAYELALDYTTGRLSAGLSYLGALKSERQDITAVIFKTSYGLPVGSQLLFGIGTGYCQHVTRDKDAVLSGMGIHFDGYVYYRLTPESRWQVYAGVTKSRAITAVTAGLRFRLAEFYTGWGCW